MPPRGRIRAADIALVRERSKIDEIVGEHLQLKRAGGGSLKGLCPFHDEKSPSFQVTPRETSTIVSVVGWVAMSFPSSSRSTTCPSPRRSNCWPGGPTSSCTTRTTAAVPPARPTGPTSASGHGWSRQHRGGGVLRRAAGHARRRAGPPVPRRARLRPAGGDRLRLRLRARRLGRADPAPARQGLHPGRAGHRRAGQGVLAGHADRPVPPAAGLADPRHHRRRHRLRRPQADGRRPGPEVPEHPRDAALQEVAPCSTASSGPSATSPASTRPSSSRATPT